MIWMSRWLLALALLATGTGAGDAGAGGSFVVRDVRLFDGEAVREHRSVLVAGGRIVRVGEAGLTAAGAEEVDGRGRTLLPGLIDCHVHLPDDAASALGQCAALGVTTVLDMFSSGERLRGLKRLEAEDGPDLADLRTAGTGASAPGGHPSQMGGPPIPVLRGPEEAQAFVDARLAEGSDYIKIIYDDLAGMGFKPPLPMLSRETLAAVVRAAHRRGKLAVVHIGSERQAREALAAGADGLAHLVTGESVAADFGRFVARHAAFVIPTQSTLQMDCGLSDGPALLADEKLRPFLRPEWQAPLTRRWSAPTRSCKAIGEAVRQLLRQHVAILAGTDAPAPGTTYGASLHGELSLLVGDGLPPIEALRAATSRAARAFRLGDRGAIRPGMRADLLLVAGDPTRDILATRSIVAVWKRGVAVRRAAPSAQGAGVLRGIRLPAAQIGSRWWRSRTARARHAAAKASPSHRPGAVRNLAGSSCDS